MQRMNTQLPPLPDPEPGKPAGKINAHLAWGFAFLVLAFGLAVALVYQWQYGQEPDAGGQVCIQVITPARSLQTGEVKDFPTPCDVPEGWETLGRDPAEVKQ